MHRADSLEEADLACWRQIVELDPELESPFLRPEFAEEVARFVPGVRVAMAEGGAGEKGFWPFQEIRPGVGEPVGDRIGCLHGLVGPRGFILDPGMLLAAAGLDRWRFDHLAAGWESFGPCCFERHESPFLDLSEGFEHYLEHRLSLGRTNRNIESSLRKFRALERDHGACRLETAPDGGDLLAVLLGWKREQMRRTGQRDLFARRQWIEPFLRHALEMGAPGFRGMLVALSVAREPVAALYGLRSRGVLHGLFLGYEPRFARYSPGIVLLVELARQAPALGLRRIELGKGDEFYKQTLKSGSRTVAVGAVCRQPARRILLRTAWQLKSTAARSAWGPHLKRGAGRLLRAFDRLRFG